MHEIWNAWWRAEMHNDGKEVEVHDGKEVEA